MHFCSISLLLVCCSIFTIDARIGNVDRSNKNNKNVAIATPTTNGISVVRKALTTANLSTEMDMDSTTDAICPKIEKRYNDQPCTANCINNNRDVKYSCLTSEGITETSIISLKNLHGPTSVTYEMCGPYESYYDDNLSEVDGEEFCISAEGTVELLPSGYERSETVPNLDKCSATIGDEECKCKVCKAAGEIKVECAQSGITTRGECVPFMEFMPRFVNGSAEFVHRGEEKEVVPDP